MQMWCDKGLIKYNICAESHPPTSLLLVSSNNANYESEHKFIQLKHPQINIMLVSNKNINE